MSLPASLPSRSTVTDLGSTLVARDNAPFHVSLHFTESFQDLNDVAKEKIWRVVNAILVLASMIFIPFLTLMFFKNPAAMFFSGLLAGAGTLAVVTKLFNLQSHHREALRIEQHV